MTLLKKILTVAEKMPKLELQTAKVRTKTGGEYTYQYVGHDTVIEAIRPLLIEHGIVFQAQVIECEQDGNLTKLTVDCRLIDADATDKTDGYRELAQVIIAYATDHGDKGPVKAYTVAKRQFLTTTFMLVGGADAEGVTDDHIKAIPAGRVQQLLDWYVKQNADIARILQENQLHDWADLANRSDVYHELREAALSALGGSMTLEQALGWDELTDEALGHQEYKHAEDELNRDSRKLKKREELAEQEREANEHEQERLEQEQEPEGRGKEGAQEELGLPEGEADEPRGPMGGMVARSRRYDKVEKLVKKLKLDGKEFDELVNGVSEQCENMPPSDWHGLCLKELDLLVTKLEQVE